MSDYTSYWDARDPTGLHRRRGHSQEHYSAILDLEEAERGLKRHRSKYLCQTRPSHKNDAQGAEECMELAKDVVAAREAVRIVDPKQVDA